jgi:tetratricopeptide (TPR) repeat protein
MNHLGYVLFHQGLRANGKTSEQLFSNAIDTLKLALEIRTREFSPQDWATTQNNLGCALFEQGSQTNINEIEKGNQLLREAISAFRSSLEVRTRNDLPQQWVETSFNLARVLKKLGNRSLGEESAKCIEESDQIFFEIVNSEQ